MDQLVCHLGESALPRSFVYTSSEIPLILPYFLPPSPWRVCFIFSPMIAKLERPHPQARRLQHHAESSTPLAIVFFPAGPRFDVWPTFVQLGSRFPLPSRGIRPFNFVRPFCLGWGGSAPHRPPLKVRVDLFPLRPSLTSLLSPFSVQPLRRS